MSVGAIIREAVPQDVPAILALVRELAEYENALNEVEASEEQLQAALFPANPAEARSHALVAEMVTGEGPRLVGLASWYVTFSTWAGRHGIWLDDLYVRPEERGHGLGSALLGRLAQIAVERHYGRVEWGVLDWNTSGIEFYRGIGARALDDATIWRLDGEALTQIGTGVGPE